MFTKILLPIDGSEHSEKTIEYVKNISKEWNSTVVVFHSYSGNPLYTMEMEEKLKQYSYSIIDKTVEKLKQFDINVKSIISKGHPGQLIIEAAEVEKCDLIVMGKHGNSDLKNFLVGSVSNFVIHHTKLPVFLV